MGFVLISVLTFFIGLFLVWYTIEKNKGEVFTVLGAIFLLYGVCSIVPLLCHQTLEDDMMTYEKAKAELEIIQNDNNLPIHLVVDYKNNIENTNELIEKSAKYHNNWYLSPFYYEEIGKLEKLVPQDTCRVKNIKIFY